MIMDTFKYMTLSLYEYFVIAPLGIAEYKK